MITIRAMQGLGDNLYLRPVLKHLPCKDIYLVTHWPQLFHDMPYVKCVKPMQMHLRTQRENAESYLHYHILLEEPDYILSYNLDFGTIQWNYCKLLLGKQPPWFDDTFTIKETWMDMARLLLPETKKKLCLIRPNTLRSEWGVSVRNPKLEYIQLFIDMYKDLFYFVSLANLKERNEWLDGELTGVDLAINNAPIETVLGLFGLCDLTVGSPSFWNALTPTINKRSIVIYGAHEPHYRINDKRTDQSLMTVVEPEPFHRCLLSEEHPLKDIPASHLIKKFKEAVDATH